MELRTLLFLLLVLACPLMMVWMMRGHGDHGHASHTADHVHDAGGSLDELRRRRAELDSEIADLEEADGEPKTPAAV